MLFTPRSSRITPNPSPHIPMLIQRPNVILARSFPQMVNVIAIHIVDHLLENRFAGKFDHDENLPLDIAVHVANRIVAGRDHFAAITINDLAGLDAVFLVLFFFTGNEREYVKSVNHKDVNIR